MSFEDWVVSDGRLRHHFNSSRDYASAAFAAALASRDEEVRRAQEDRNRWCDAHSEVDGDNVALREEVRGLRATNAKLTETLVKARVAIQESATALAAIRGCAWQQIINHIGKPLVKISEFKFADGQYDLAATQEKA